MAIWVTPCCAAGGSFSKANPKWVNSSWTVVGHFLMADHTLGRTASRRVFTAVCVMSSCRWKCLKVWRRRESCRPPGEPITTTTARTVRWAIYRPPISPLVGPPPLRLRLRSSGPTSCCFHNPFLHNAWYRNLKLVRATSGSTRGRNRICTGQRPPKNHSHTSAGQQHGRSDRSRRKFRWYRGNNRGAVRLFVVFDDDHATPHVGIV